MEHKFKTYYQGKLIDCEISTFDNLIAISKEDFFQTIGRYKNTDIVDGGLPLLPLYEFTGKLDKNRNPIYRGHRIRITFLNMICIVDWSEKRAAFILKYADAEAFFEDEFCASNQCEIIEHIDIDNIIEADFAEVN